MNKSLIIAIVAILAIGGGAAVYYASTSSNPEPIVLDNQPEDDSANQAMKTLKELVAGGQSLTCTFSREDENGNQEGTVYISGEKVRGDFTIATQGSGMMEAHMITDSEWMYTWSNQAGQMMGAKFSLAMMDNSQDTTDAQQQGLDFDQAVDYKCQNWRVDNSKFIPPANVTFTEINTQALPTPGATNQGQASQCAACDQVPAESRAQCLQALGC